MLPGYCHNSHSGVSLRALICGGFVLAAICAVLTTNSRLRENNKTHYRWAGQGKADIKYFLVGRKWSVSWTSNSSNFYLEVFDIDDNPIVNSAKCKNPASGVINVVSEPGPAYMKVVVADKADWEIVVRNKR